MAIFHVYADESGKLGNSDYTSFCGYVGFSPEWERVSMEWNSCRLRWGVPPIHMAKIRYPERDEQWATTKESWGSEWEGKAEVMLREFAKIVLHSSIVCIGAVIDSAHFRNMQNEDFKDAARTPHYLCFHEIVMSAVEKTELIGSDHSISLVLDDAEDYSIGCYSLLNQLKRQFPKIRKRVVGLCFVNDAEYPGVQAADMISYETRRMMVERKQNPSAIPSDLYKFLTMGLNHQPKLYDAGVLDVLVLCPINN